MDYHISSIAKRLAWGLLVLPLAAAFITGCSGSGGGGPVAAGNFTVGGGAGMDGGASVIPTPAEGDESDSTGTFSGQLNEDEDELTYTVTWDGIETPTVLHFHQQAYIPPTRGVNTDVLGPVCEDCAIDLTELETAELADELIIPDAAFLDALNRGLIYVDVHSEEFPADADPARGEIGSLLTPSVPDITGSWTVEGTALTGTETVDGEPVDVDLEEESGTMTMSFEVIESEDGATVFQVTFDDDDDEGECAEVFGFVQNGMNVSVNLAHEEDEACLDGGEQSETSEGTVLLTFDTPTHFTGTYDVRGREVEEDDEGNVVVTTWTETGTLEGDWLGAGGGGVPVD